MVSALRPRGPDSEAIWEENRFSMGSTRLAILDAPRGNQPFISPCGRVSAVCNGEIYNWRELRVLLEQAGHRFVTQCDCEILPAAWLEWGQDLPSKLNGMFALAIHDGRTDSLFLARDRCGQKPLYYTSGKSFRFASEVKALAAADVPLQPDPRQLSTWLSLRYLPEPETLFKNIVTLPAAHWMIVSAQGEKKIEQYWKPKSHPHHLSDKPQFDQNPLNTLDKLARSSVELALQSDVPLACYLSAGVDSSLLAFYLKDLGTDPTTVSIGFGAQSDECSQAAHFAKSLGLTHHSASLPPSSLTDISRVIHQMDRPIGDALILAFDQLASHTSELGYKVALGGEGPDEHFAGYSFHKALLQAERLGPIGRSCAAKALSVTPGAWIDRLANFPASLGEEGRSRVSRYLRDYGKLSPFHRTTRLHQLFEPQEIADLLHPDFIHSQAPEPEFHLPNQASLLTEILATQYQSWLPDWSLIRQDKNTMAHSLEYRAPFLDHRLIDFAFSLPDEQKIRRGTDKYLWRKLAARHLPAEITQRPKQPFYLPLESPRWREPLLTLAREVLTEEKITDQGFFNYRAISPLLSAATFLPLKKLAALLILQIWLDTHLS